MFDYDDSINLAFDAKIAGKSLVAAKHELLTKTGEFLFLAHSDRELAFRMQMIEEDIEKVAYRKLSSISDSKAKLVRVLHEEWSLRHASCEMCKISTPVAFAAPAGGDDGGKGPNDPNKKDEIKHPDNISLDHMQPFEKRTAPNKITKNPPLINTGDEKEKDVTKHPDNVIKNILNNTEPTDKKDKALFEKAKIAPMMNPPMNPKINTGDEKDVTKHPDKIDPKFIQPFKNDPNNRKSSKGDQKNCAECGKPATHKDVRGYLELCDNCAK